MKWNDLVSTIDSFIAFINYRYLVFGGILLLFFWGGMAYAVSWGTTRTYDLMFTVLPEVESSLRWEPSQSLYGNGIVNGDSTVGTFHMSVSGGFHLGARFASEYWRGDKNTLYGFAETTDGNHRVNIHLVPGNNATVREDPLSPKGGDGYVIYGETGSTFFVKTDGTQKVFPGEYVSRVEFATWYE